MKLGEGDRNLKQERVNENKIKKIVKDANPQYNKLDIEDKSMARDGRINPEHFNKQYITIEKVKEYLPKKSQIRVTQAVIDDINNMQKNYNLNQEFMEEKFMTHLKMSTERGVGLEKYVQALKYVELTNYYTNEKAWSIVFPKEYKKLKEEGRATANHAHSFERSKTVLALRKAAIVPEYISNYPGRQKMFYKLVRLANGEPAVEGQVVSPHVQFLAIKEFLDQTKMPEDNTVQLKIGASDALLEQQQSMANSMEQIVNHMKSAYESGVDLSEVQQIHIVHEEEVIDV